jgi:hypothetical protein
LGFTVSVWRKAVAAVKLTSSNHSAGYLPKMGITIGESTREPPTEAKAIFHALSVSRVLGNILIIKNIV